jgi:hypothetical protein
MNCKGNQKKEKKFRREGEAGNTALAQTGECYIMGGDLDFYKSG